MIRIDSGSRFLAGVFLVAVNFSFAQAQIISTYIQSVRPQSAAEAVPLTVTVTLSQTSAVSRVVMFYRQLGTSDFHSIEMQISRDAASAVIPAEEVAPPFVELYIVAETQTGARETYPSASPQTSPARITILPRTGKDTEVLILNPEAGAPLTPDEIYVTLSFVYADNAVAIERTRILLNGVDLSSRALAMGDLLIVGPDMIPDALKAGPLALTVELYDTTGAPYHTLRRSFIAAREAVTAESGPAFALNGSGQMESRSESIKGAAKTYNRLDARANATYGILKTTANLQLTSEERPENQPQNRYYIGFDARYIKLGFGDTYPQFPTTIMDSRRVRGASLDASYGAVRVSAATGEIVRGTDLDGAAQTHRRTLTAVRPSFGKGENFQWGLTYLHAIDEWNTGAVLKPQENVAAGTDLLVAFDEKRIQWTTQASMSINNLDISSPQFTADSIDAAVARGTLDRSDAEDLKKLLPIASKIITFNENLTPLNPSGLSSLAFESAFSLNYFNNFLKGTYTYHGNDYSSFGTTSFRRDVQGYNITDRLRLLNNSLFVTASVEQLSNNVSHYDPTTTIWTNTTASVSYFAAGRFPDLTVGVSVNNISNDNLPVDSMRSVFLPQIDYATRRLFVQSSYSFAWIGTHSMLLSADYSNADDRSVRNQDVTGVNGMLFVTTVHSPSLETTLGVTTSVNTLPLASYDTTADGSRGASESMNYTTFSLGAGWKFLHEKMKATAMFSPTIGNFTRTQLEAGLQYEVLASHVIAAQYHYIINSSLQPTVFMPKTDDSAFMISYRMTF